MKIRSGFVSNSSSSSFTCDICGKTACGMDLGLNEAGMVECQNEHTFCEEHQLPEEELSIEQMREKWILDLKNDKWATPEDIEEAKNASDEDVEDWFDSFKSDNGVEITSCPCCQLQTLDTENIVKYAFVKCGVKNAKGLARLIKAEFQNYDNFQQYLKKNL